MRNALIIFALAAFVATGLAGRRDLLSVRQAAAVETGVVGIIVTNSYAETAANWGTTSLSLANVSGELFVVGQTNLASAARLVGFETSSEDLEITWDFRCTQFDAHSAGVGVGLHTTRTGRSFFGLFAADSSGDGSRAYIFQWNGSGWTEMVKSAQITYSANDTIRCRFIRTPLGFTFTTTNTTAGGGTSVSTNLVYSTINSYSSPGPSTVGIWSYKGSNYINNLSVTNTATFPSDIVVLGTSLVEGYTGGSLTNRFTYKLGTNYPTRRIYNYAGSAGTLTNTINGIEEIKRYRPAKALLMIGNNDIPYGYSEASWKSNYNWIATNLTASGITLVHAMPTPQSSTDLTALKTFVATNYVTTHIGGTWTNLLGAGTSLGASFDAGDGIHLSSNGMYQTFLELIASPLLP